MARCINWARSGLQEVEAAGYFDKTAADFRHSLEAAGLRCMSTHHPLMELKPQAGSVDRVRAHAGTGVHHLLVGRRSHRDRRAARAEMTLDDWRYVADEFNKIGEKVKAAGHDLRLPQSRVGVRHRRTAWCFYDELMKLHRSQVRGFRDGLRMGGGGRTRPGGVSEQDAGALSHAAREGPGESSPMASSRTWC